MPRASSKPPASLPTASAPVRPRRLRSRAAESGPTLDDYLRRILNARVYDVAHESALTLAKNLSQRLGHQVWLKREDTQPVFSFKLRGAYNKMAQLSPQQLQRGVICASAGNHAQGVALGARRLGCRATIVMPVTTPQLKIDAVKALDGDVLLFGESYSDAYQYALELERERGAVFVHPFDDPDVIAGQGTVAMEILRQHQGPIDAVFVAVGGGGLISGVAAYIKAVRPEIKVIGVQMVDSNAMARSVQAGKRVTLSEVGLFSDGTAVKLVGQETLRLTRDLVDDFILVDSDAVCAAIKDIYQDTRSIVEPAGALGVAAIKQYCAQLKLDAKASGKSRRAGVPSQTLVSILCGANMNFDRLRFVAERAEVGEEREALFAVTIPEERGSFKRFCALISPADAGAASSTSRQVTEFNYRISDDQQAQIFLGLTTTQKGESSTIARQFQRQGFPTIDLTHDELAKTHIRHMVGGRSELARDERLFRFTFPERPGALMTFLSSMHPDWNISLFHYRNLGADYGRILIGLQVPRQDSRALREFLDKLGYPYVDETSNPVYRLFLR